MMDAARPLVQGASLIMRKYLLILVALCAVSVASAPALAQKQGNGGKANGAHTRAGQTKVVTGEHCKKRVQASVKLSAAGKAIAAKACADRAAAISVARSDLREARQARRAALSSAHQAFREAVKAAASLPEAERAAAIAKARSDRRTARRAVGPAWRSARKAVRAAVKAARKDFRTAMKRARAA